jgi:hypothetical protein
MKNLSKALTWDDLATIYDKSHSGRNRRARTLPMDYIFKWAKNQKDKFHVKKREGTIHKILI